MVVRQVSYLHELMVSIGSFWVGTLKNIIAAAAKIYCTTNVDPNGAMLSITKTHHLSIVSVPKYTN
jgi:hypothetical protein